MATKSLTAPERYTLLSILSFLLIQLLLSPFIWGLKNLGDIAVMLLMLWLVTHIIKTHKMPLLATICISLPFIMHSAGIMGAYASVSFLFTFDKWMHLIAGFSITLFALGMMRKMPLPKQVLLAFLIAMGLGAITEILEFIGHFYFDINVGGIFTFGDGQPLTGSALQTYDSYFDMIFQAIGNCVAILLSLACGKTWR